MKKSNNTTKASGKKVSSREFAEELKAVGVDIGQSRVRALWADGWPCDVVKFAQRHRSEITPRGQGKGATPAAKALKEELLKEQVALAKLNKEERKLDLGERRKSLWKKADVIAARKRCAARVKSVLETRLLSEFPAKMGGRPPEDLEAELRKIIEEAYRELSQG